MGPHSLVAVSAALSSWSRAWNALFSMMRRCRACRRGPLCRPVRRAGTAGSCAERPAQGRDRLCSEAAGGAGALCGQDGAVAPHEHVRQELLHEREQRVHGEMQEMRSTTRPRHPAVSSPPDLTPQCAQAYISAGRSRCCVGHPRLPWSASAWRIPMCWARWPRSAETLRSPGQDRRCTSWTGVSANAIVSAGLLGGDLALGELHGNPA